jgi:hypothetical protein
VNRPEWLEKLVNEVSRTERRRRGSRKGRGKVGRVLDRVDDVDVPAEELKRKRRSPSSYVAMSDMGLYRENAFVHRVCSGGGDQVGRWTKRDAG